MNSNSDDAYYWIGSANSDDYAYIGYGTGTGPDDILDSGLTAEPIITPCVECALCDFCNHFKDDECKKGYHRWNDEPFNCKGFDMK